MFAPSTTINGSPRALGAGITYVRDEVLPAITTMDGCVGLSMIAHLGSGRCITTTAWRDRDSLRASTGELTPLRSRAARILGGDHMEIEEWEAALMHREHAAPTGASCRVTWTRRRDLDAETGVEFYRQRVLPSLEMLDGFCSASLLINRETGMACSTTTFESPEHLIKSRRQAMDMRESVSHDGLVDVLDIDEFDVVIAHLGLPELV